MKVKIVKNKKTLETRVEYFKVDDKSLFRFNLLKKALYDIDSQATLIIDTNQFVEYISKEDIEEILNNAGTPFTAFSIAPKADNLLGIRIDRMKKIKKKKEMLYIIKISFDSWSKVLFDAFFRYYDLAFCINAKKTQEEICEILKTDSLDEMMFDAEYFENYIYDSIVCETIRSSVDIQNYV